LLAALAPFETTTHSAYWIGWSLLESAGWALVIVAWTSFAGALPRWCDAAMNHAGRISFSFYLLHLAVLHLLTGAVEGLHLKALTWAHGALLMGMAYGASWLLATLSFHTIEAPFLRMRRSYTAAAQPGPASLAKQASLPG
jgi:peptidoglycan/LPS O-acetylase OafA/YrhL